MVVAICLEVSKKIIKKTIKKQRQAKNLKKKKRSRKGLVSVMYWFVYASMIKTQIRFDNEQLITNEIEKTLNCHIKKT